MTTRTDVDRLWTRDFVLAAVVNFFISAVFYMFMTTMALCCRPVRWGGHRGRARRRHVTEARAEMDLEIAAARLEA
ncbi:hypothetical protein FE374_02350 [Georgenia yuyongxinii]|uniref:Uncharacterized protein n=1 Tax=Georgenia yuyongxinii TaxID=2589797 RepID=A0A5B8C350_9MICO|nr:hypothetical protein [Georgenia yuyongxinii]QDC23622.1 hypothetical protein FE374_02350 [Georgenia yuyongxinii]